MSLTEQQTSELKAKWGDELRSVESPDGTVCVFHPPKRDEYNRWVDKGGVGSRSAAAMELAQTCLAGDRATMIAVLDKYPGMLLGDNGFIDAILQMCRPDEEASKIKKL